MISRPLNEAFDEIDGDIDARRNTLRCSVIMSYIAVVLQLLAVIFGIVWVILGYPITHLEQTQEYADLNSTLLHLIWEKRLHLQNFVQIYGLCGSLAWLAVIPVIRTLSIIYRRNTLSSHMFQLIMLGSVLNFLEFCITIGNFGGASRLYSVWTIFNDTNHANDGGFGALQALELNYKATEYSYSWVFGMDFLLLSAGFALLFRVTYLDGTPLPTKCNSAATGIMSISCIIAFIADLISTLVPRIRSIAAIFTLIFEVAFIVWLLVTAVALTRTMASGVAYHARAIATSEKEGSNEDEDELSNSGPDDEQI